MNLNNDNNENIFDVEFLPNNWQNKLFEENLDFKRYVYYNSNN